MRSWPGLAAIGAGLIHLGVAAGSAPAVLAVVALIGALETGWGVVALARITPPRPRTAFGLAVLLVAGWVVVLLNAGGGHAHGATDGSAGATASAAALPIGALTGAGALDLALAVVLGLALRSGRPAPDAAAGPWRFLIGTAIAAGAVAVVTASSLAGTPIGGHHLH